MISAHNISIKSSLAGFATAVAIASVLFAAVKYQNDGIEDMYQKYWDNLSAAQSMWLSDCKKSGRAIDDCAFAWDRSLTLKNTYLANVKGRE